MTIITLDLIINKPYLRNDNYLGNVDAPPYYWGTVLLGLRSVRFVRFHVDFGFDNLRNDGLRNDNLRNDNLRNDSLRNDNLSQ